MDDDEKEEWERLKAERRKKSFFDRLYDSDPAPSDDGSENQQKHRRTGRLIALGLRGHPRTKAMMIAIRDRDEVPSLVVLLELALEAYLKVHGAEDLDIPSDDEIIERLEAERDKRLAPGWKKPKAKKDKKDEENKQDDE